LIPAWGSVVLNLAFVGQYAFAFSLGIIVNSNQFLDQIKKEHLPVTLGTSFIMFFLLQMGHFFIFTSLKTALAIYGYYFFATLFEQFYAFFFAYSLLVIFKEFQNAKPSKIVTKVIDTAHATYIMHQWAVVPMAIALAYFNLHPLLAIFILCLITPFLSWGAGMLIKKIPKSDKII
jgi:hypothetical protein